MSDATASIDVQAFGLEVFADLSAGLRRVAEEQARQNDLMQQAAGFVPTPVRVEDTDVCGSTGTLVLDLGGPTSGRAWDVRSVVIGGSAPSTTAGGTGDVYVSAAPSSNMPGRLADWRDRAATLPDVSFYGAGEMPLRYPEHLFVVILGGTNTQEYSSAAQVIDRRLTPSARGEVNVG